MGESKPEYRVTQHSGTDGTDRIPGWGRRSTVSRTTTQRAAQQRRQEHREALEDGSSDWFTVEPIRHREASHEPDQADPQLAHDSDEDLDVRERELADQPDAGTDLDRVCAEQARRAEQATDDGDEF